MIPSPDLTIQITFTQEDVAIMEKLTGNTIRTKEELYQSIWNVISRLDDIQSGKNA